MREQSSSYFPLSSEQQKLFEALLQQERWERNGVHKILPRKDSHPIPLSFSQQRLWFLEQLQPGHGVYNIGRPFRVVGEVDCSALERSLQDIVQRHEALRTIFPIVEGKPVQHVLSEIDIPLMRNDLQHLSGDQKNLEVSKAVAEAIQTGFDLSRGPLIRHQLLQLQKKEFVWILTMHHIVSDGWSMEILIRELTMLYHAHCHDLTANLPPLRIQYPDFSLWQRDRLQGAVLEQQQTYWKPQLDQAPLLEMPLDYPRPAVQSFQGAAQKFAVPRTLFQNLKALGRKEQVTSFMVLLAAFKVLLSKYSGQSDLVVGTPITGRTTQEVADLIGFFANSLAIRTRLTPSGTFRQFLSHVKHVCLGAYAHQDIPFELLVKELQLDRDLSRNPVFQVVFSFHSATNENMTLSGLTLESFDSERISSKFDLTLFMIEQSEELRGVLEFNTTLFTRPFIEQMVGHFLWLLENVVRDPNQRLSDILLLNEDEQRQQLLAWNTTTTEYPHDSGLSTLFEEQVAIRPDALAVVAGGGQLTYGQLDDRANQLAQYLRRHGVGPESRVGVCLERSLDYVVSLLAILKAGGAYVPLDPTAPVERVSFLVQDAAVEFIVTQACHCALLDHLEGVPTLALDQDWPQLRLESTAPLAGVPSSAALAYVMYTSGSTGQPKGTLISHRSVVRLVKATNYAQLDSSQRILQLAPMAFDASTFEVWGCLLNGGRLVIVPSGPLDLKEIDRQLEEERITTVWLTAGVFRQMVEHQGACLSRVEQVLTGGDVLSPEAVTTLLAYPGAGRVINGYGPTENTTFTCCQGLSAGTKLARTVPIGHPISNTQVYVVDPWQQLVPRGVTGELLAGGDGLAWGYLNQPALTAEKFLPHPYAPEPGARVYRTGDQVRWNRQEALEFLGRRDGQVKIRGFRVELGEIEAVLQDHPAVQEAVVLCREDRPGEKELVAYVVTAEEEDSIAFRAHLKQQLPGYMVPSVVIPLKRMPLTPNGKVDKRALPKPGEVDRVPGMTDVAPRTPEEQGIAEIWQEVLEREQVGIQDNFIEIGGHSLLATQVVSRIRGKFNVELSLRKFFECPTVAGLAERVSARDGRTDRENHVALQPVSRNHPLPLSFAQQRLWFLHQLDPDSDGYNSPWAVRLTGALDLAALKRSFHILIHRHETLRTSFPSHEGTPRQVITTELWIPWRVEDARDVPVDVREKKVRALVSAEVARPFILSTGPAFRVLVVQVTNEDHVLVLTMHHIISDGWSRGVLSQELEACYRAEIEGRRPHLPALPIQYVDYAVWQRAWLQGPVLEEQVQYWRTQLAGMATLAFPTDLVRPAIQSNRGASIAMELPSSLQKALHALSQAHGVTLTITLLAAFKALLVKYTGQTDIVVGSPIANRIRPEVEGLIGFFVNSLVLRTNVGGNPTFEDVIARVRETSLGAYDHQDVPFEQIVEELQPQRDLSRNPLFQILFAVQNAPFEKFRLPGIRIQPYLREVTTTRLDLECNVWERGDAMRVNFVYNSNLFAPETIVRLGRHFQRVLEAVVKDSGQRLSDMKLLEKSEEHQQAIEWNSTSTAYPNQCPIVTLFEEQVKTRPDTIAVVVDGKQLTYSQLNDRANQLAQYLRRHGVGPESRVGVYLERSIDYVVSMLAILKAGAAYVPLDPTAPVERVSFLVQDAAVEFIVTQACHCALLDHLEGVPTLALDQDWPQLRLESTAPLAGVPSSAALAYVMYTSGSTGQPKGTLISHRSVVRLVKATNYAQLDSSQRILQLAPMAFDASTFEVWGSLLNGGRLVIVPSGPPDLKQIGRQLEEEGITTVWLTAGLFHQLVESEGVRLSHVKQVLAGGDVLFPKTVRKVLAYPGTRRVINGYGPTENTTFTCCYGMTGKAHMEGSVPIGQPISNTQVYVVDPWLQLVPRGVTGELLIGGDGVAWGYLNQPGLTAEKFVPHPYAPTPGARVYRTGDQVRWNQQGAVEFQGRRDGQIKLRGFRIELGEIEATLNQHIAVEDAVVLCREDEPGKKELVAYVVGGTTDLDVSSLRTYLQDRLPGYMVPGAFVVLEQLPLTPNGKVDKRALPVPKGIDYQQTSDYVPAEGRIENLIAGVWEKILQVDKIGVYHNFFEVGGNSLSLIEVQMALQKALDRPISIVTCFQYPTIRSLADFLATDVGEDKIRSTSDEHRRDSLSKGKGRMRHIAGLRKLGFEDIPGEIGEEND